MVYYGRCEKPRAAVRIDPTQNVQVQLQDVASHNPPSGITARRQPIRVVFYCYAVTRCSIEGVRKANKQAANHVH